MRQLLSSKNYNSGKRPSEHNIGAKSFLRDNNGAIPPNVLIMANTRANDLYLAYCREHGVTPHPARMQLGLPKFFIEFLTEPGDIVMDPFAGSNTTGAVAEQLGRRWISIEIEGKYVTASNAWFL
jgi:site-specific DNA-methyltransferase (cytosine-N4-specific)